MAVLRTQDQVHGWNWPYQVKAKDFDTVPTKVDDLSVVVQEGDVIIAASDGVLDNLFDHALQELVADQLPALFEGSPIACQAAVDALAQSIAQQASAVGLKRGPDAAGIKTPFMANAAEEGRQHVGGKLDDVAVVCGLVQSGERPPQRVGHNFKAGAPGAMSGMVAPTAPMGVPAAPGDDLPASPGGLGGCLGAEDAGGRCRAGTGTVGGRRGRRQLAQDAADAPHRGAGQGSRGEDEEGAACGSAARWRADARRRVAADARPPGGAQMPGPPGGAQMPGPPGGAQMPGPPGGAQMPGPPGGAQMPGPPGGAQMPGPPGGAQMPGPPGGAQMPGPPGGAQMPGPPVQPMSQRPLPLPDASPAAFAAAEQKFQQQLAGSRPQPSAPGQLGPVADAADGRSGRAAWHAAANAWRASAADDDDAAAAAAADSRAGAEPVGAGAGTSRPGTVASAGRAAAAGAASRAARAACRAARAAQAHQAAELCC